jgi:hypothetical protein
VIVAVKGGFVIKSESGDKTLSKVFKTREAAEKRLKQIEYFKNRGSNASDAG